MRRAALAVFMPVVVAPGASAQEDAPWPPDPDAIFAEGVEVVEAQIMEENPRRRNEFPYVDNAARMIYIYDEATTAWLEYPYAEDIEAIYGIRERSDGTYVIRIAELSPEEFNQFPAASVSLIFNPATREFSPPEAVCDDQIRTLPGETQWRFYVNPADEQTYLCSTETGELEGPLPDELTWSNDLDAGGQPPRLSPDGRWAAFFGYGSERGYLVYGYEFTTDTLNELGVIDARLDHTIGIGQWVSNTQGAAYKLSNWVYIPGLYYAFDVTRPGSLEFALAGWPNFDEGRLRYEDVTSSYRLIRTTGSVPQVYVPCALTVYDSAGIRQYPFGYHCIPIAGDLDNCSDALRMENGYLYLRQDEGNSAFSNLVYFDLQTERFAEILTGEIERILSTSPDGRYIALVTDTNGNLDLATQCGDRWYGLGDARIAVFDREIQTFIYSPETAGFAGNKVIWYDSSAFLVYISDSIQTFQVEGSDSITANAFSDSVRLVTIRSDNTVHASTIYARNIPESLWPSPDQRHVIAEYSVIDFQSGSIVPVLQDNAPRNYRIRLFWAEDGALSASVRPDFNDNRVARFTLRLPQPASQ